MLRIDRTRRDSIRHYLSTAHRAGIRSQNKAGEKFADVPDAALLEDIRAFLVKGAKDGDARRSPVARMKAAGRNPGKPVAR